MKKGFMVALALIISIAFVSAVFAQAKPETAPASEKAVVEKEAPEKAEAAKTTEPAKPKPKPKPKGVFIGTVSAVSADTKTVTVDSKYGTPGEKGSVTFVLNNPAYKGYKSCEEIQVGDKIAVKYTKEGIEVKQLAGKKPEKAKKELKKDKKVKKDFKDLDANKDGKITIEEMVIVFVTLTPEQFKELDKNNDGALDKDEYQKGLKAIK